MTRRRKALVGYVNVLIRLCDGDHDGTVVHQIDRLGVGFIRSSALVFDP